MLYTILVAVFVLGVLIFVHELGHFLVAKLVDIQVLRFSIGLGKPICPAAGARPSTPCAGSRSAGTLKWPATIRQRDWKVMWTRRR